MRIRHRNNILRPIIHGDSQRLSSIERLQAGQEPVGRAVCVLLCNGDEVIIGELDCSDIRGIRIDAKLAEELAQEDASLAVHAEAVAFVREVNRIVECKDREAIRFEFDYVLTCVGINVFYVRNNNIVFCDLCCFDSSVYLCLFIIGKRQVLHVQLLEVRCAGDLPIIDDDTFLFLGCVLRFTLILSICSSIICCAVGHICRRIRRRQVRKLRPTEIEEYRNIIFLRLEFDLAVALCVRHQKSDVVEEGILCVISVGFLVFVERTEVCIVGVAFHALVDLGYFQSCDVRNRIRRVQADNDTNIVVSVVINNIRLLRRLVLQSDDSVFCQRDVLLTSVIRKACLPCLLIYFFAQAVDRRAVDLCFLICIGNFVSTVRALNALDLLYFLVDRRFLQVDGVLERRKILFLIIFDCFTIFVDDLIGQLDLRRVFFIVEGDRGVFRHLDFFAVNDHVIGDGLFVELMDDFLLRGGAVICCVSLFCAAICGCCFFRSVCRSCIGRSFALCRTVTGLCLDLFGGLFSDLRYLGIIDRCFYICISINHTSVISVERKRGFVAVQGDGLSVRAFDCLAVRVDIFRGELDFGIDDLFLDHDLLVGLVRLFLSLHGFISVDNRQSIRHCSL